MLGFLIFIHTVVSVLLVIVILMQASSGGGLSGTFGSAATSAIFGGRGAATVLSKLTTWLAVIFMALAVVISLVGTGATGQQESLLKKEASNQVVTPGADLSLPAGTETSGNP
ncbi:MAG: preprotein translocase subunit SecG [Candidatus Neomarinimicrobiota bacterium]|nr:MAG: preprotein translocase subunit SecG [Candidatus Neomarinimicrobiota bacterium]